MTTETNDVLRWTLALLLLVPIYTATLPPSIQEISGNICTVQSHTLSELIIILYLLALVILTLFSLVDTITEGS